MGGGAARLTVRAKHPASEQEEASDSACRRGGDDHHGLLGRGGIADDQLEQPRAVELYVAS